MHEPWAVHPAGGQLMWRLVGRSTPQLRDFQSNRERGRPRALQDPFVDHVGISVFETKEQVTANAIRFPAQVAVVEIAPGYGFSIARTYAEIEGHHTVWGDAGDLLGRVQGIDRLDEKD